MALQLGGWPLSNRMKFDLVRDVLLMATWRRTSWSGNTE